MNQYYLLFLIEFNKYYLSTILIEAYYQHFYLINFEQESFLLPPILYNTFDQENNFAEALEYFRNNLIKRLMGQRPSSLVAMLRGMRDQDQQSQIQLEQRQANKQKQGNHYGNQIQPQNEESIQSVSAQDWLLVESVLIKHKLLFTSSKTSAYDLKSYFSYLIMKKGEYFYKKGDRSSYFYIILYGSITFRAFPNEKSDYLKRGEAFGDLGIQKSAAKLSDAMARERSELLVLDRQQYMKMLKICRKKAICMISKNLAHLSDLQYLGQSQLHKIAKMAKQICSSKKSFVFRNGQVSNSLYIIKNGQICIKTDYSSRQLEQGAVFGEQIFTYSQTVKPSRNGDAFCVEETTLFVLNKSDFVRALGINNFDEIEINCKLARAINLHKKPFLCQNVLSQLIKTKKVINTLDQEVILSKGELQSFLFISLEEGLNNESALKIVNSDYLFNEQLSTSNLVKTGKGRVAILDIAFISNKFKHQLEKLLDTEHFMRKMIESTKKMSKYLQKIETKTLRIIDALGGGSYGPTLRIRTQDKLSFAMRVFYKQRIEEEDEMIATLRKISNKLCHKLIANPYSFFHDKQCLYCISRFVEGQDLLQMATRQGKVPVDCVRHFAACIISIMEYMHRRSFVWRELKIESFVIDSDGYLNLVDLLYIDQLLEGQKCLPCSTKNSLYYISPQTISNEGYSKESDYWCLGVIIYRLSVGEYPFGSSLDCTNQQSFIKIAQEIQSKSLNIPDWIPQDVSKIISMLLNFNPVKRSLLTIPKIKFCSFFAGVDWMKIMEKTVEKIPYKPEKTTKQPSESIFFQIWNQHKEKRQKTIPKKNDKIEF